MGVKCFIRCTQTFHTATCASEKQAQRLYEVAKRDSSTFDVCFNERAISFWREYEVVGNWEDDEESFQNRLERRANIHATWTDPQRNKTKKDRPRPLEDVIRAVQKSRQHPTQIQGCAGVPRGFYVAKLRALGYNVK